IFPAVHLLAGDVNKDTENRKIRDLLIYEDSRFYAAFPSIVKDGEGNLITAFRRAPDRRIFMETGSNHVDPNSYLVYVTSDDNGVTWTSDPKLLYAHAYGGSQDPCLLRLRDGSFICSSYGWAFIRESGIEKIRQP